MRVLFRTDANAEIGVGHLMRCLALAQTLVVKGHHVLFAVLASSDVYCETRDDWVGERLIVPENLTTEQEMAYLDELVNEMKIDSLVLDGYQFTASYRESVAESAALFVCFDDNNQSGNLHADVVINGANNALMLGYENSAPHASLCLGADYRILRQEFIAAQAQKQKAIWQSRQTLSVVMGGSDPLNLTRKIVTALDKAKCHHPITLVTGAAYPWKKQLKGEIDNSTLKIDWIENCQDMAAVFLRSKLVISAAGGTQFELLACATPAILLVVADNQENATVQAEQQGWCKSIDFRLTRKTHDIVLEKLMSIMTDLMAEPSQLKNMHDTALEYSDVEGAARVVNTMLEQFKIKSGTES